MKSIHFEAAGRGGPFLQYVEPMQGMPAPAPATATAGEHEGGELRMDTVGVDKEGGVDTSAFSQFSQVSQYGDGVEEEEEEEEEEEGDGSVPRAAISLTLQGDVQSIAANTAPRRAFEKHFLADVSAALAVKAEQLTVLACRSGSIIVDFYVEVEGAGGAGGAGGGKRHEGYLQELKRQLMDPTSLLLNGKVTNSAIGVRGEVEYYLPESEKMEGRREGEGEGERQGEGEGEGEGEDVVRRSGNFAFTSPHDGTLVVPGAPFRPSLAPALRTSSSTVVPVKVRGGVVARNGERDAPQPLFYYP